MESNVMKLLDLLEASKEANFKQAKLLCDEAEKEIKVIENENSTEFTKSQNEAVVNVKKIIGNVKGGQMRAARTATLSTTSKYYQHIVGSFPQGRKKEHHATSVHSTTSNPERHRYGQDHNHHGNTKTGNQHDTYMYRQEGRTQNNAKPSINRNEENRTTTNYADTQPHMSSQSMQAKRDTSQSTNVGNSSGVNTYGSGKPPALVDEEYARDKKSKWASQAMRHNNPDIADLSDANRPTKLAEKFSELYDNEWTEAFEVLSKKNPERAIITLLLEIVQEANKFCKEEACKEIEKIESVYDKDHMTGSGNRQHEHGTQKEHFVQYLKNNAGSSVKRLQDEFYPKLVSLCTGKLHISSRREGKTAKYSDKAVELAWWMNVQDPPVYMCPTTQPFDQNLYRAYTKSGNSPDFFVWPALRLYEKGGLLAKGVVQYKS